MNQIVTILRRRDGLTVEEAHMIDFLDDQQVGNYPGYAFQSWYRHEYLTQ